MGKQSEIQHLANSIVQEVTMNIAEHKLNLIRQIDQLPEESLLELEEIITKLRTHNKTVSTRKSD